MGRTSCTKRERLLLLGHVGDEVGAVLGLLDAGEDHLGAGDELLGVLEVLEEVLLVPGDTRVLVGSGVGVALAGAGLAADDAVEVGALLGLALSSNDGVALEAELLEDRGTL